MQHEQGFCATESYTFPSRRSLNIAIASSRRMQTSSLALVQKSSSCLATYADVHLLERFLYGAGADLEAGYTGCFLVAWAARALIGSGFYITCRARVLRWLWPINLAMCEITNHI